KGVDILPKTKRIFGNFEQFGEWSNPDPSFDGHIIVDDDGKFIGYQNELYGAVAGMEDLCNDLNNIRFVTGYIVNNGKDGAEGVCYLKLSQDSKQSPLLYVIPDITKDGQWAAGSVDDFLYRGHARVSLEEVAESDVITTKVDNLRKLIQDNDGSMNRLLSDQSHICLEILLMNNK
ncbi:MAG: hypothetical protein PHO93_00535, partial [Candidatus Saccharimonadaceae bacterium]|nr:hypothetical protein [Candidatus Saccharimonadaceae bacterium]